MKSVLVLNATYQPLHVVSLRRAVNLINQNKAVALDNSGEFITFTNHDSMEIPYVILLTYVVKQTKIKQPRFSRRGVMVRDDWTCVYCSKKATTIDHVTPQSKGGQTTFDNCVACCLSCNSKKGDLTLEQLGWAFQSLNLQTPSHASVMLNRAPAETAMREAWETYVFMYEPHLKKEPVSA